MQNPSSKVQEPVQPKSERLQLVDALRGIALLGILITHCSQYFSPIRLPSDFYQIHAASVVDRFIVDKMALLFENKFYTIFSFLFGLSFTLILSRSLEKPAAFKKIFARRLFILGIIGLLHYLHWRGDILLIYALLGWPLLLFNQTSNKIILLTAMLLVLNIPTRLMDLFFYWDAVPKLIELERQAEITLSAQREISNFRVLLYGSYTDTILDNLKHMSESISFQFSSGRIYKTLGFFLVGLYAGRQRLFQHLKADRPLWWKYTIYCVLAFLGTKVSIIIFDHMYGSEQQASALIKSLYQLVYDLGNASQTLVYIGSLTLFFQYRLGQWVIPMFSPIGTMALTNYLLQTLLGSLLFFGYGLGLLGVVDMWEAILLSVPIFLFELGFSKYWMKHFRYGPVEWVWRSLIYGKAQAMRV
ncbi:DUF418 domain-containing protein [Spirosoma pollinicola]|uniref:DUF418 domain-containing protein n=1 Tax=Spirosoma pollinicola TaxID=2057025 RepID=A0A2K8Z3H2_9BACT|nr:DUF418 domain-containing protein [Spirosoma pollinicola]AUD04423.1 hypothetical protein CWM47_22805 [Spirosoma pollinicola]